MVRTDLLATPGDLFSPDIAASRDISGTRWKAFSAEDGLSSRRGGGLRRWAPRLWALRRGAAGGRTAEAGVQRRETTRTQKHGGESWGRSQTCPLQVRLSRSRPQGGSACGTSGLMLAPGPGGLVPVF